MEAGCREQKCACNLQQEESGADFYKRRARNTSRRREAGAGKTPPSPRRQEPAPEFRPGAPFLVREKWPGKPKSLLTVLFHYTWEEVWFRYPPPRRHDGS